MCDLKENERESETKTNNVFIEHKQTRKKRKTHSDCVLLIKRERAREDDNHVLYTNTRHTLEHKQTNTKTHTQTH